jgi:adenylate cyclase class 2
MALEIEIKLKIEHLAPLRDRLREIGAQHIGERLETNIFFDTPERALLASDCGLRLRRQHDIHSKAEKIVITYKGPRSEGPVKSREEIETRVDDLDATTELLSRLGYQQMLSFEKRRESWQINKSLVELDTLPELGHFVEIECPTQAQVLSIRQKLGLGDVPPVASTYADLVALHLSDMGQHQTRLSFTGK